MKMIKLNNHHPTFIHISKKKHLWKATSEDDLLNEEIQFNQNLYKIEWNCS